MANHIKKFTDIQVTSGGGWVGLIIPYNYATCDSIDILAIHDYSSPHILKTPNNSTFHYLSDLS